MLTTAARETNHTPVLNKLIPSTDSAFGRTAITSCSVTTFCFYIIQSQNSPARYQLTEHMNWQRHTRSSVHACVWDSILRNSWSCRCITYLLVCLLTQTFPIEEGVASSKMAYSRLPVSGDDRRNTRRATSGLRERKGEKVLDLSLFSTTPLLIARPLFDRPHRAGAWNRPVKRASKRKWAGGHIPRSVSLKREA